MDPIVIVLLALECAFALFLLFYKRYDISTLHILVCSALVILCFAARLAVMNYETLDYQNFLSQWVQYFRSNGGFRALGQSVGNYNIPYLYFLAFFSYLNISDLYLIKLLSIFFDVVLAWAGAKLVSLYTKSGIKFSVCFILILALPTVFLNGAVWGQCDVIYTAFAVLGIYLALSDHPVKSLICFTLSFGFKLQAVFILPIVAVLMLSGKIKIRQLFVIPLTYIILVLPAVIAGRPFIETLTLYFSQTGSIGSGLNYNSSSVYAIFWQISESESAARIGIVSAFAFMFAVLIAALIGRKGITKSTVLSASLLFSAGIPFLLPHMHDRYFFAADIISLILAVVSPEYVLCAVGVQFASLLGYHAYLKMRYLLPMRYGSYALIAVLIAGIFAYATSFVKKNIKNS